jgi:hypothetical protein
MRLEVLRFRQLDGRARQALGTMLRSLTTLPDATTAGGEAPRSLGQVLDDIVELVERAGPLGSRTAHFAARLVDAELTLALARPSPGEQGATDRQRERPIARVRRVGSEAFRFSPGAEHERSRLRFAPSTKDPDGDA